MTAHRPLPAPEITLDRVRFVVFDASSQRAEHLALSLVAVSIGLFVSGTTTGQWAGLVALGGSFWVFTGTPPTRALRFDVTPHEVRITGLGGGLRLDTPRVRGVAREGQQVVLSLSGPDEHVSLWARATSPRDLDARIRLLDDCVRPDRRRDPRDEEARLRAALEPLLARCEARR